MTEWAKQPEMLRHVVQRLLISVPVLLGVLMISFLLLQIVPADPAAVLAGPMATQETVQAIRQEYGLDRPVWEQILGYLGRVAQGDLGRSIVSNIEVSQELGRTIGPTVELMLASMIWAAPLGILLGTLAAVRRGRLMDRFVMGLSVVGVSMPVFFVGILLIQFVALRAGMFPVSGRAGPIWTAEGFSYVVLPALTLGSVLIGPISRITRTAVLEVLGADFVRTARAKGLEERVVIVKHALRNALIPIVTLIGLQVGFLLGGAVVTETIFAWPGVGRLAVGAINSADTPVALGAIFVLAVSFLAVNLIVDLLYAYLDPRVKRA